METYRGSHFITLLFFKMKKLKIEKVWELDLSLSRQHGNQLYRCEGPTPAFFERMNTAIGAAKRDEDIED